MSKTRRHIALLYGPKTCEGKKGKKYLFLEKCMTSVVDSTLSNKLKTDPLHK